MADEVEKKIIKITPDGGVLKEILQEGVGTDHPTAGCKVSVHYTGRLTDGTKFDSSVDRGEPFEFDLNRGKVIRAFDMGIATMKLGEKCDLTCAPEYAYGASGSPPTIPPNATLIFTLEMLGWKGEDLSPNRDGSIERIVLTSSEKKRTPTDGAAIKVHLTGKLGEKIFEERELQFEYGEGSDFKVIEGVEIALGKMMVGETSKIKVKPKYAYGDKGNAELGIPPNADVEYIVKLLECEKAIEEWKLSADERVSLAQTYKEKGTNYFKKEKYPLALKWYTKCIDCLSSANASDEIVKLKIAAHNNQILCHQKTEDFFAGKNACDEVLKLDPNNIKALYRRGLCYIAINEFKAGAEDFERVMKLEPTNKAAQNQLNICMFKMKESNEKERKIYANMFTKFAAVDRKNNQNEENEKSDVLEQCGEWQEGEITKTEADLAFERDDIIMI